MSAPSEPINKWEFAARQTKALKLFEVCRKNGITSEEALAADEHDWSLAAQASNVKPPSRETQDMVIQMLLRAEREEVYSAQRQTRGAAKGPTDIPTRGAK